MKIIKTILLILVGAIVLALLTGLFVKKEYSVERAITINKPKAEVFAYIKLLKNQDHYSKWATMDAEMIKDYRGTDGSVGFVSSWDSKKDDVGAGEQEIKNIVENERLDFELRFKRPFESTEAAYMTTESASDMATTVKWGFNGKMPYPMNLMLVFMNMEEMIGGDLETGLTNLKTVLESAPAPAPAESSEPAATAPASTEKGA